MKIVLTIIALLIFRTVLPAQAEPDYRLFKGRVKSCREESFKAKESGIFIDKTMHKRPPDTGRDFEIQYDTFGRKISKIEFEIDGQAIARKHEYTYDGNNHLAEIRTYSAWGDITETIKFLNTCDSAGRLLGQYVTKSNAPWSSAYFYTYTVSDSIYEYILTDTRFPLNKQPSRLFDSAGKVVQYWSYTQHGHLIGYATISYDSLGNKIQEMLYDKHDKNYLNYSWTYKGASYPERSEKCKANSTSCESWVYRYEYDKTGNWVKCTEYRNGKPAYIKERTFSYYQ